MPHARDVVSGRNSSLFLAAAITCLSGTAVANNGRYLPDTANLNNVNGFMWIDPSMKEEYNKEIRCGDMLLGHARFTYDMWKGTSALSGRPTGGAALAGGFFINPDQVTGPDGTVGNVMVCDGWQTRWVQIVQTTINGSTEWGVPNLTWFPDTANGRTSPAYPAQTLPGNATPPNPPPDPGFQDFPARFPHQGDQIFRAELALCVLNASTETCCIVGSFMWGYDVTMNPAGFVRMPLGDWVPNGSGNLSNVLVDAFDGNGLSNNPANSTQWSIETNCCQMAFCVQSAPSPASGGVLALGMLIAVRRRR